MYAGNTLERDCIFHCYFMPKSGAGSFFSLFAPLSSSSASAIPLLPHLRFPFHCLFFFPFTAPAIPLTASFFSLRYACNSPFTSSCVSLLPPLLFRFHCIRFKDKLHGTGAAFRQPGKCIIILPCFF